MEISLGFVLTVFFGCVGSVPLSPTSALVGCQMGDNVYNVGESWHPILEPTGLEPCLTCRCNSPGRVSCDRKTCPDLSCESFVHIPNQCCPVCAKKNGTTQSLPTAETAPTVFKSICRFRGREYYDGQTFPGNWLAVKKTSDCVQCTCSGGLIYCAESCPDPGCSNPTLREGSCCPVCVQEEQSMDKANDISIPAVSMIEDDSLNNFPSPLQSGEFASRHRGHDNACHSNGETYYHGQHWNPIIRPFGRTNCLVCICKYGVTECGPVFCPAVEDMPCKNPVRVRGQCCKVCQNEEEEEEETDTNGPELSLCLSEFQTHLLYTYRPIPAYRDGASFVTYAVEDLAQNNVRISQWEVSLGVVQEYLVEEIPSVNFERAKATPDRSVGRFHLIGATTKRRFEKLLRRESRLQRRCTEECLVSILKLTKVLRVTEVERSLNCSQSDRSTTKRRRSI